MLSIHFRFESSCSDEGYLHKNDVKYLEKLHNLHKDLSFLRETMKIGKPKKFVANMRDKMRICQTKREFETSIKSWISI